jgi:hypothetical protein
MIKNEAHLYHISNSQTPEGRNISPLSDQVGLKMLTAIQEYAFISSLGRIRRQICVPADIKSAGESQEAL